MALTWYDLRQNTCRKFSKCREVETILSIDPLVNVGHDMNYDRQRINSNVYISHKQYQSTVQPCIMNNTDPVEPHNNEFILFLRTILMVLENHNFQETVPVFKTECQLRGYKQINDNSNHSSQNKPSPKIIFENFSNTAPYRIIIENKGNEFSDKSSPNASLNSTQIISNDESDSNKNCVINIEDKSQSPIKIEHVENAQKMKQDMKDENSNNDMESSKLEKEKHNFEQNESMASKNSSPKNNSTPQMDTKNKVKNCDYDILRNKFSTLQDEHQKLMDVVTELTFALQTSINGQIEDTHIILNNCEKIYPELFCKQVKNSTSGIAPKNVNQKVSNETGGSREIKSNNEFVNNDLKLIREGSSIYKPCFSLDFHKIKHDLKNADLDIKLNLLQALRWRITKSSSIIREDVIRTYIRYDILNVHSCTQRPGVTYPKNSIVFTSFYCSCKSPQALQQAVTRFVNAFASLKIGRDYIIHQSVIINILLSVLLGTHPSTQQIDDISRDMIIASLQKMSLRYAARITMITDGLTEHIVKFVTSNFKSINEYCLEYSTALLRNLWLHSEAREKCRPFAKDIMTMLASLLDDQYRFCLPYITGSLYNLLPDQYFNEAARNINLEQVILSNIEKLDGEMKEQMQYILEIYLSPQNWQPLCECDLGTDSENEIDVIEPEIDQNETLQYSEANGEQFLYNYRMAYSFDGGELNSNHINTIFSVPVTPNICNRSSVDYNQITESYSEIHSLEYAAEFLNDRMNKKILSITNHTEYKQIQMEESELYPEQEPNEETDNIVKETAIEMTFCEDTQQFYHVPTKSGIFESDKSYNLHTFSPSFLKTIGDYDLKNISKSLPVSPRNKHVDTAPSTARSTKTMMAQYLSPTANFSGMCYREGLKPRSFSDSSAPHIGFCDENSKANNNYMHSKYSCACFAEMQRSIEEENKKNTVKNNNEKADLTIQNETRLSDSNKFCKYKCYPTSNSAPTNTSSKKERESGGSKSVDETDYTAVFESRPRLLRTP